MYMLAPELPAALANGFQRTYRLLNKWYFDELYDRIFVKTSFLLGYGFWKSGDGALIDGVGPMVSRPPYETSRDASPFSRAFYHYAFAMLLGYCVYPVVSSDQRVRRWKTSLALCYHFRTLVGVFFILLIRGDEELAKTRGEWAVDLTDYLLCLPRHLDQFVNDVSGFQFEEKVVWVENLGLAYHLG